MDGHIQPSPEQLIINNNYQEEFFMISASDFRNGRTVEIDGEACQIIEFQHVKPGKGAAFVRTKYRKIISGAVIETSFKPEDKFDEAIIDRTNAQYLYDDGDSYIFMDNDTYEQIPVSHEDAGDAMKFVIENMEVKILSFKGKVFSIEPPISVELTVTQTDPGFKGNTATNATKPATVESGATIMVPLFIEEGEKIKIDTRTGEYSSRA